MSSMEYTQNTENQNSVEALTWLLLNTPTFPILCMKYANTWLRSGSLLGLHTSDSLVEFFAYKESVMCYFS